MENKKSDLLELVKNSRSPIRNCIFRVSMERYLKAKK